MSHRRVGTVLVAAILLGMLAVSLPAYAHEAEATVLVGHHRVLGTILTDHHGKTLYMFTRDNPDLSTCYGACATNWPPLLIEEGETPTLGEGIPGKPGTTARTDGKLQVTYDGMPLYYWIKDKAEGDATGEGVNNVWFVINPKLAPTVKLKEDPTLGKILVGPGDMTLYMYTKDKVGTSTCYNACATNWPPFLTTGDKTVAPTGLHGQLGTTIRTDGKVQVTFNGMPLYYWVKDVKVGDTTGQKVNSVWFVVNPGLLPDAAGHWGQGDVTTAVKGGWVQGLPDGAFHPNDKVTRAEFVTMITGAFGTAASANPSSFSDTGTHWAAGVIESAVAAGILKVADYVDGKFAPDQAITREEVVVMAIRALGADAQATTAAEGAMKFADGAATSARAAGHLGLAVQKKILNGYPDNSVGPTKTASRAEAVTIVIRALKAR